MARIALASPAVEALAGDTPMPTPALTLRARGKRGPGESALPHGTTWHHTAPHFHPVPPHAPYATLCPPVPPAPLSLLAAPCSAVRYRVSPGHRAARTAGRAGHRTPAARPAAVPERDAHLGRDGCCSPVSGRGGRRSRAPPAPPGRRSGAAAAPRSRRGRNTRPRASRRSSRCRALLGTDGHVALKGPPRHRSPCASTGAAAGPGGHVPVSQGWWHCRTSRGSPAQGAPPAAAAGLEGDLREGVALSPRPWGSAIAVGQGLPPVPHLNLSCVPTPQLLSQRVQGDQADQPQDTAQDTSSHVTTPSWHTLGTDTGLSCGDGRGTPQSSPGAPGEPPSSARRHRRGAGRAGGAGRCSPPATALQEHLAGPPPLPGQVTLASAGVDTAAVLQVQPRRAPAACPAVSSQRRHRAGHRCPHPPHPPSRHRAIPFPPCPPVSPQPQHSPSWQGLWQVLLVLRSPQVWGQGGTCLPSQSPARTNTIWGPQAGGGGRPGMRCHLCPHQSPGPLCGVSGPRTP